MDETTRMTQSVTFQGVEVPNLKGDYVQGDPSNSSTASAILFQSVAVFSHSRFAAGSVASRARFSHRRAYSR